MTTDNRPSRAKEPHVPDLLFAGLTVAFFAVAAAYVYACGRS